MCGIYGVAGRRLRGDFDLAHAMDTSLIHRGPDESGVRRSPLGVMGMRRLSIIDLSSGSQPISNEAGTVWVTLNGEIYNYRALREELAAAGHQFATSSDTEVIAHGYEEWGDDLVLHLRGMFAFAVWDEARGRILFGRDRIGKKPLYFLKRDGRLSYASEIKAFLLDPEFSREIDRRALWHYLTFKHVPAPFSIFRGITQLPAGHVAIYEGGQLRLRRYWKAQFTGDGVMSEEEAAERLLAVLEDAVKVRVEASDVPVGAFLSGGIDSSLVVALMAKHAPKPLKTFSMGYVDRVAHKNDIDFARGMAERFGTQHYELELTVEDVVASLPAIVRAFDEPFGGTVSPFWLSRLIASHVKVALSGDGADELFGSYAAHRMASVLGRLRSTSTPTAVDFGSFEGNRELALAASREPDHVWRTRFGAFTDLEKRELLSGDFAAFEPSSDLLAPLYADARGDLVNATLEVECRSYLPDQVLTYVDRLSMAHSLEVRVPFLDQEVIAFAATLPGSMKVRPDATKAVLKRAAAAYLPAEIIGRRKEGFVLPMDAWLKNEMRPLVHDALTGSALDHGLFRPAAIAALLEEHESGRADHTYKIWSLTMFQLWHMQYMEPAAQRHGVVGQEVA